MPEIDEQSAIEIAGSIVVAYLENNTLERGEVAEFLTEIHNAIARLSNIEFDELSHNGLTPAVPIDESVAPNYIVCLEDGQKLKMLKRYLKTHYDLSPEEYRQKWGLHANYPMVAPNYSKRRSSLAKEFGLGKKGNGGGRPPKAATRKKKKKSVRRSVQSR